MTSLTPALVSAVTLDIENGGFATVVYPCALVLRHGFNGAPLKRTTNLLFNRLRAYSQTDASMKELQELLLSAVRAAASRKQSGSLPSPATPVKYDVKSFVQGLSSGGLPSCSSAFGRMAIPEDNGTADSEPGAGPVEDRDGVEDESTQDSIGIDTSLVERRDTTQENINALFSAERAQLSPSRVYVGDSVFVEASPTRARDTTQDNINALFQVERSQLSPSRANAGLKGGASDVDTALGASPSYEGSRACSIGVTASEVGHGRDCSTLSVPEDDGSDIGKCALAPTTPNRDIRHSRARPRALQPFPSGEKEPEVTMRVGQRSRSPSVRSLKSKTWPDFRAFTSTVSRAFGTKVHVSMKELVATLCETGLDLSEVSRGLGKLESAQKIFTADAIVFRCD